MVGFCTVCSGLRVVSQHLPEVVYLGRLAQTAGRLLVAPLKRVGRALPLPRAFMLGPRQKRRPMNAADLLASWHSSSAKQHVRLAVGPGVMSGVVLPLLLLLLLSRRSGRPGARPAYALTLCSSLSVSRHGLHSKHYCLRSLGPWLCAVVGSSRAWRVCLCPLRCWCSGGGGACLGVPAPQCRPWVGRGHVG